MVLGKQQHPVARVIESLAAAAKLSATSGSSQSAAAGTAIVPSSE